MLATKITLKQLVLVEDGLGGKTESYKELDLFGKIFFKKATKVVTRVYDTITQSSANMYVLYLNTYHNKIDDLISIKKGDILDERYGNYRVDDIEAHNTNFIITFLEEKVSKEGVIEDDKGNPEGEY